MRYEASDSSPILSEAMPRDVATFVDGARFNAFHAGILATCFVTALIDGFDNQAIGFATPAISASLGIPLSAIGVAFAAGLAGGLLGAVIMGSVADRIGRRNTILSCTALFAVFTLATSLSENLPQLAVLRFLAGVGLGGAMPCFLTIVSEFTPKSARAMALGILWCGYPAGGMLGGAIGSYLVPHHGWESIFALGGVLSFLVLLAQWAFMRETLQYLALRPGSAARMRVIAGRMRPNEDLAGVTFTRPAMAAAGKLPVRALFAPGLKVATPLLWLMMFCTYVITSFFVLWVPSLLQRSGETLATGALMIAALNLANLPSQAASGHVIDRFGPFKLLPFGYLSVAVATAILSQSLHALPIIGVTMVLIGFFQGPGLAGSVYLATRLYPDNVRSTGAGWATAIGRSGQIAGSLVVGAMFARGLAPSSIALLMCIPPIVAVVAVIVLGRQASVRAL